MTKQAKQAKHTKQTITLTEGLAKLKLYDKKIKKQLKDLSYNGSVIDYKINNDKGQKTGKTEAELKADAESRVNKALDLINNRNKLKAIIAQTNATTTLKVGDKEYTIVQAIERKNGLETEKNFVDILENQFADVVNNVTRINSRAQDKANQIVEAQVSAEAKNKKTDEIEALYNLIYEKNKAEIMDPLGLEKLIEKMKEEIEDFEQNIDVALSIVNAKTEIEIDFDE